MDVYLFTIHLKPFQMSVDTTAVIIGCLDENVVKGSGCL